MTERIKLTVLGGSALATPLLFETMGQLNAQNAYTVTLFGQDNNKLELVKRFSEAVLAEHPGLDVKVQTISNAKKAIEGSHYILNQIRVGGLNGRLFDETFPRRFGVPGEETVGPGGFSNSIRGIPVILDYCRMVEKYAPDAIMLNLSNPSSIIQYAIQKYTKVNVVGTCDTPISTIRMVADSLSIPIDQLSFDWFGMHHFGWVIGVRKAQADLFDQVLNNLEKMPALSVDSEIVKAVGAIPASYLKYYFHPDRILAATEGRTPRAAELIALFNQMQIEMEAWQPGQSLSVLKKRGAAWYDKIVVPTLLMLSEKKSGELILSVQNKGSVPWLPTDAIVELPVKFEKGIINGGRVPKNIPLDIQGMVTRNSAYESLAAEAIVEKDRNKAIRALQSNLLLSNFNQVRGILEQVWPNEPKTTFVQIDYPHVKDNNINEGSIDFQVPTLHYGEKLIEQIHLEENKIAVITMEIPWKQAESRFSRLPQTAIYVEELDWYRLESIERSLPEIDAVIGLGGGMAVDAAKYIAWRRHVPIDAIPTITSVDACVTKSVAARIGGHVTYIGYIVPRNVFIDYKIIKSAPPRLNRSGVGDILCAHTALYDWKLSYEHTGEKYDLNAVEDMQQWLKKIELEAQDIASVNEKGIQLIMEAFADISIICRKFGSSRPQEGSDHTFAYNAEYQTGRSFLHGELVALGAYVMANLQNNGPDNLRNIYKKTGILWQPRDVGLSKSEISNILRSLNWYQKNFGRRFTVLNVEKISETFIERMVGELEF
jgi:6-phospho-beta-glucosidase